MHNHTHTQNVSDGSALGGAGLAGIETMWTEVEF